jgi:hypothetical protein
LSSGRASAFSGVGHTATEPEGPVLEPRGPLGECSTRGWPAGASAAAPVGGAGYGVARRRRAGVARRGGPSFLEAVSSSSTRVAGGGASSLCGVLGGLWPTADQPPGPREAPRPPGRTHPPAAPAPPGPGPGPRRLSQVRNRHRGRTRRTRATAPERPHTGTHTPAPAETPRQRRQRTRRRPLSGHTCRRTRARPSPRAGRGGASPAAWRSRRGTAG